MCTRCRSVLRTPVSLLRPTSAEHGQRRPHSGNTWHDNSPTTANFGRVSVPIWPDACQAWLSSFRSRRGPTLANFARVLRNSVPVWPTTAEFGRVPRESVPIWPDAGQLWPGSAIYVGQTWLSSGDSWPALALGWRNVARFGRSSPNIPAGRHQPRKGRAQPSSTRGKRRGCETPAGGEGAEGRVVV